MVDGFSWILHNVMLAVSGASDPGKLKQVHAQHTL
jgi:hypothetical protein